MERNKIFKKIFKAVLVAAFWLAIWELVHLCLSDSLRLFLPSPFAVFKKWFEVGFTKDYLCEALYTLARIFVGFATGVIVGIILGVVTANVKILDLVFSPAITVVRAVPVVSFIILAFLFINVDYLPIFISFLMVLPLIWQTVSDGIKNGSKPLDEMCRTFGVGRMKTLFYVKIPAIIPQTVTASVSALGFAWKSGVAAEVLCTPEISLGHRIYSAKTALSFDEVYAVTLTVVILSLIIEVLLKYAVSKIFKEETDHVKSR